MRSVISKTSAIEQDKLTQSQTWPTQFAQLEQLNLDVAGIDVGSAEHSVCVPAGRDQVNVRSFGCFTPDLQAMAAWLKSCGVTTVAMESAGVY